MFFFITLYMQNVLGFSPIAAGTAYLPVTVGVGIAAGISTGLVARIGTRPIIVVGAVIGAGGVYWLSRIPVHGSYLTDLLPGLVVMALGLGAVMVGVQNAEWICDLVAHGLVRASFVPPPEIRRLRDFTRLRKAQINERARVIQRLEKVLQEAGIKLTSVASGPYSKSARAMLEALLSGISAPEQLAELAKARMRQKIPQLREALAKRFQIEHHGILVAQTLAHIDTLDRRSPT
jgi:hypothetical protein